MSLPIQISPSPIVTSTVELRIKSNLSTHQIFSLIFPKVEKRLPTVVANPIANQINMIAANDQLKYLPAYILSNAEYSLSIGENVVSFANVNEYTLWQRYFAFINETLTILFSIGYISDIERIGVRYASLFNNILDINEILKYKPSLNIEGYEEKFHHFRGDLKIRDFNFHVQLFNNARAQKNNALISGAVIDIDASYTADLKPSNNVFSIIDELHHEEKVLFFEKIVKEDFIQSLNPKY